MGVGVCWGIGSRSLDGVCVMEFRGGVCSIGAGLC